MENNSYFQCQIDTTDPSAKLGLEVWLNDQKIINIDHVAGPETLKCLFDDESPMENTLKFVLKNKLDQHTKIDEDGNILSDVLISIKDLMVDDILLGHNILGKCEYTHNFNGHGEETTETFTGFMGCNGTVTLKFSTPIYLWLLENM